MQCIVWSSLCSVMPTVNIDEARNAFPQSNIHISHSTTVSYTQQGTLTHTAYEAHSFICRIFWSQRCKNKCIVTFYNAEFCFGIFFFFLVVCFNAFTKQQLNQHHSVQGEKGTAVSGESFPSIMPGKEEEHVSARSCSLF